MTEQKLIEAMQTAIRRFGGFGHLHRTDSGRALIFQVCAREALALFASREVCLDAERRERVLETIRAASLPPGFQWGADAMEQFNFGKERAALAVAADLSDIEQPAAVQSSDALLMRLASALYDIDNTGRLQEHPEEQAAYLHRAAEFRRWAEINGVSVTEQREGVNSSPEPIRLDAGVLEQLVQLQGWLEEKAALVQTRNEPGDVENAAWAGQQAKNLRALLSVTEQPEAEKTSALKALRLHDEYLAVPQDRGGPTGPKGLALQAFLDAKHAALKENA